MGLQIKKIKRTNGANCQHLSVETVLDEQPLTIQTELARLRQKFSDEPGGYKGLLLLLFAAYQEEGGREPERMHLYIA